MHKNLPILGALTMAVLGAAPAGAAIVFSEIQIGGSLAGGATSATGAMDIDFSFPNALVGDPTAPTRDGTLTISFIVTGTAGERLTKDILSILGAVEGRGLIQFSEIVEDLTPGNQGQIASLNMTINTGNPPPRSSEITFSRSTSMIKVTKTVSLAAEATTSLSIANVSLIEQTFVPTPGALALSALGLLGVCRRRR